MRGRRESAEGRFGSTKAEKEARSVGRNDSRRHEGPKSNFRTTVTQSNWRPSLRTGIDVKGPSSVSVDLSITKERGLPDEQGRDTARPVGACRVERR